MVSLKNTTQQPREYTVQIDFEGGAYMIGMETLAPGQTLGLDLLELRQSQRPDIHGTVIPLDAAAGEVQWSAQGEGAQHSMLGRAEYVDASHGLSTLLVRRPINGDLVSNPATPFGAPS